MHISRIFFWHCKWLRLPAINYWISTAASSRSQQRQRQSRNRDRAGGRTAGEGEMMEIARQRGAGTADGGLPQRGSWHCQSFSYVNHINHTPRLRFHLRHWHMKNPQQQQPKAATTTTKGRRNKRNNWHNGDAVRRLPTRLNQPWNANYSHNNNHSNSSSSDNGSISKTNECK